MQLLLLVIFVELGCATIDAQPMKRPDTTDLKILLAGHQPGIFPYKDSVRDLILTTSVYGVNVHSYFLTGHCRGCDYWAGLSVSGNHLPPEIARNLFQWKSLYVYVKKFEYNSILFGGDSTRQWAWDFK